ncbi:ABC transporter ATP-binding protein [Pusillimonas minor]|uniref:ATP-binding cassette domain-containing protein n=1 Tax=Pusillimonas minor TaxID=2697024 RepID=A0A842HSC4_9BURK|nr:ATP-binding cassette domain-containing protein [Pusillimonas minor]MBC2770548.1 ATP-binding cassette domain-containing protein [Pusillimonas minor]
MTDNVFELSGVTHARQGREVLHDINLCLARGRPVCLVGPSGSGKTSFLRLLNRLETPVDGRILFNGKPIEDYPVRRLRTQVGFAFQTPAMFDGTVHDNLTAAVRFSKGKPVHEDQERMQRALELAELSGEYLERPADQLSGGEKQRVALARTLMTDPAVLLLDEPTSALDPDSGARLINTLKKLSDAGMTIIMSTHRLDETEALQANVVTFDAGRVVSHKTAGGRDVD